MTEPTTIIRPATLDDAQAIAHVHIEAWQTAYREIMPAAFLNGLSKDARRDKWVTILGKQVDNEFNLAAEHDGRIVGFASGGPERKNDPEFSGELYAIYLLEEYRRQGIGSVLLRNSVESLLALGMKSLKVWVLRDNPYRKFYERHGGVLLAGEETIKIGDMEMIEVAYGWTRLRKATQ